MVVKQGGNKHKRQDVNPLIKNLLSIYNILGANLGSRDKKKTKLWPCPQDYP